jgi:hypothetical protein
MFESFLSNRPINRPKITQKEADSIWNVYIYIGAYMQSLTLNVDLLGFQIGEGSPNSQPQVLSPGPSGWCCHRGLARLLVLGRS